MFLWSDHFWWKNIPLFIYDRIIYYWLIFQAECDTELHISLLLTPDSSFNNCNYWQRFDRKWIILLSGSQDSCHHFPTNDKNIRLFHHSPMKRANQTKRQIRWSGCLKKKLFSSGNCESQGKLPSHGVWDCEWLFSPKCCSTKCCWCSKPLSPGL